MSWKNMFRRKSIEILLAEMAGEHQLHRVLGPVALTALGVGAIIGAGIFVVTGRAASIDAGPAIIVSYTIAAVGCALAALCYAEFAAMAPVAGSAYTYAYATLGELIAWIIGWDLMLEYAMACATVAASWSGYLNEFLLSVGAPAVPAMLTSDPFSTPGAWFNLPAVLIMGVVTLVLVRGIRESANANAVLVLVKVAVVLFVIFAGVFFINPANWTSIPVTDRVMPEEAVIPALAAEQVSTEVKGKQGVTDDQKAAQTKLRQSQTLAVYKVERAREDAERMVAEGLITDDEAQRRIAEAQAAYAEKLPTSPEEEQATEELLVSVREKAPELAHEKWGMLGLLGLNRWLTPIDDAVRSPFMPYGFSGIMLGASIVFFAYIGFDSISTHAEEARTPHRDVPIAILTSLAVCTVLYIAVSAVITGIVPYPTIDHTAPLARAFADLSEARGGTWLRAATALIAAGGLAGMTSVLLVTFLSQVRVFMAMARDGLLPKIFGQVHPKYRTPHLATMLTGAVICIVCAFTPILKLTEMVNIGTLMAFVVVCASVLLLRIQRPDVHRPFRCPVVYFIAPAGILVNLTMMLFFPWDTWLRLLGWLGAGMAIYLVYGRFHSRLTTATMREIQTQGIGPTDAPLPD